jgi:peptidoglycan hydrolase-like protein with peptidoglycan-binding domain
MAREVPGVRSVRNDTTYGTPKASLDTDRSGTRARSASMRKDSTTADRPSTAQAQPDVRAAQEKLKDKGYDPGPVDGIWGPRTAAAISEYQRKEKMTITNRLDTETLAKLEVAPKKPQSP